LFASIQRQSISAHPTYVSYDIILFSKKHNFPFKTHSMREEQWEIERKFLKLCIGSVIFKKLFNKSFDNQILKYVKIRRYLIQ
jgi:hypothetical protein